MINTAQAIMSRWSRSLQRLGDAMRRHQAMIQAIQWCVVTFYLVLVTVPAFLQLPPQHAHIYDSITLFAQFIFWGIWWPFVMVSTMLFGRVWCGVFCPEGALSELASRHGLGKTIPRWLRWGGWPLVAFVCTTVYGQLISAYEYPKAALLILGGSTVAAVAVGFIYGRGKRVWCRYLCPASGVFALLAKVAPLHFSVDAEAWRRHPGRTPSVGCAPLVDIRHMRSASPCHVCGRCSGYRGAVALAPRRFGQEILNLPAREARPWEAILLIYGLIGVAVGAFQWSVSPWFVVLKTTVAEWLIEHDSYVLLRNDAPWWILTHYPAANEVFTWLDGLCILAYIGGAALLLGGWITLWLWTAERVLARGNQMWRLAYSFIPLAGLGAFLGLSMLTVTMINAEGLTLPWLAQIRGALLGLGTLGSLAIAGRMVFAQPAVRLSRRVAAWGCAATAAAVVPANWILMFYVW